MSVSGGNRNESSGRRRRERGILPDDLRESVVDRLRDLQLSFRDVAARTGLHLSEVSRLLRGERGLTVDEAARLAEVLDWHPVRLLPGAPPLPEPTIHLPVYRWGSCGDPRDRESVDDPDHEECIPFGARDKLDAHSFGVMVEGESMTARDIHPLNVVWVNPNEPPRVNRVALARAWDRHDEELGMVVKVYAYEPGTSALALFSDRLGPDGRPLGLDRYDCARAEVIGPIVWVTAARPPGGPRSVSEIRPGYVPKLPPKAIGPH